jgi:hypothetical protein
MMQIKYHFEGVLRGYVTVLKQSRPIVVVDTNTKDKTGKTIDDAADYHFAPY